MTRRYSLAYLTMNGLGPLEAIAAAAGTGYDHVSFRLLPVGPGDVPPPLIEDAGLRREVMRAMADHGLTMLDAELIRMKPDTDPAAYRRFLDCARAMGARHVLVAGDDTDRARITDTYGRLCEELWSFGLTADLEFMPWTGVKTLADARDLVAAVAHPAAAILFDALHFDRSGSRLEDLAALPAGVLNYVQICDGPVPYDTTDAGLIEVARTARLIPGEGGIDLAAIVALLSQAAAVSVEIPNRAMTEALGAEEVMRRALEATKALIEGGAAG